MSGRAEFAADLSSGGRPFPHFWEHTVGSGHALLALRADWQEQMARCHRELGFRHVRFHGILSDDVGTLVDEQNELIDSFFNAEQIWDFLLSIGMRPFVELSFMPTALASGRKTVFHYRGNVTPPKSRRKWAALVRRLAGRAVERYGREEAATWPFEVWNEPNLTAFWTGSRLDYFRLYRETARAIKEVDASLTVGGPATAKNAWIEEFLDFCREKDAPLDFVSTHHYPTDDFGKPGDDTLAQLAASRRSALRDEARAVRRFVGGRPLYYTEWSSSSNPFDSLHDEPYAAAFAVKTILEATGIVDGYSWWTFSDIFEENYFSSVPFHGGFGLLTLHGVAKPVYRGFELLHRLGDETFPVKGNHDTADAWVVRRGRAATVILTNWALPRHDIEPVTVRVTLTGNELRSARLERIDEDHGHARPVWERMGKPTSLTRRQLEDLHAASVLGVEKLEPTVEGSRVSFEVVLPVQSVAAVTLEEAVA
ncbi:MAG: glycosyl hydrolase [Acidobacteriota bacterium]|nr:glycosyl hydrolase [Acidobacteriota bacterium]